MARVVVTEVTSGDDVTETDPNSTISSWNLQTASIEGDNIRDGGIHQRNIAAETVTVDVSLSDVQEVTGPDSITQAAWAVVNTAVGGDMQVGPFDIDTSSEDVIVWMTMEYNITKVASTNPIQILELRLAYSVNNGSSWTAITSTNRAVAMGDRGINMRGSFAIAYHVEESIDATQTLWRLEARETEGQQFTLRWMTMFVLRRKL